MTWFLATFSRVVTIVAVALSDHLAAGPIAGSFFQAERALYWLAHSDASARVGIEVLDDVAIITGEGLVILEQDKNSVGSGEPLADRSRNLWNTFATWLEAVRDADVDLDEAQFFLTTNKQLGDCWVRELQRSDRNSGPPLALAVQLRALGSKPPKTLAPFVSRVLAFSDTEIAEILQRTNVEDASTSSSGAALRTRIAERLLLPKGCDPDRVMDALLGWIVNTTLILIRSGKPAWLEVSGFATQLFETISAFADRKFRETAASLLKVTDSERAREMGRLFVDQIRLLEFEEEGEQVIEAIDDYLRCQEQMTRFAQEGSITEADVRRFQDGLQQRWQMIFRRHCRTATRQNDGSDVPAAHTGQDVFQEVLEHREALADQATTQFYLTKGTYHRLADTRGDNGSPSIGWHPEFADRLKLTASANLQ